MSDARPTRRAVLATGLAAVTSLVAGCARTGSPGISGAATSAANTSAVPTSAAAATSAATTPAAADPPGWATSVSRAEQKASDVAAKQCLTCPTSAAALLGSIAAADASHVVVLQSIGAS